MLFAKSRVASAGVVYHYGHFLPKNVASAANSLSTMACTKLLCIIQSLVHVCLIVTSTLYYTRNTTDVRTMRKREAAGPPGICMELDRSIGLRSSTVRLRSLSQLPSYCLLILGIIACTTSWTGLVMAASMATFEAVQLSTEYNRGRLDSDDNRKISETCMSSTSLTDLGRPPYSYLQRIGETAESLRAEGLPKR
jgi:hypothetical protein